MFLIFPYVYYFVLIIDVVSVRYVTKFEDEFHHVESSLIGGPSGVAGNETYPRQRYPH